VIIAETYGALVLLAFRDLKKDFPVFSILILGTSVAANPKNTCAPRGRRPGFPKTFRPYFLSICVALSKWIWLNDIVASRFQLRC
jgi:hypothetical protein